jgi:hypothetical protein
MDSILLLITGVFALVMIVGAFTGAFEGPEPVRCYEDEVIVWTGETHDRCVPLDNLWKYDVNLGVKR